MGRILFDTWNAQQKDDDTWDKGKLGRNVMLDNTMHLTVINLSYALQEIYLDKLQMKQKIPLQGAELEEYLQNEKIAKEKEEAQKAAMARSQQILEADEDDDTDSESDGSDDEDEDGIPTRRMRSQTKNN